MLLQVLIALTAVILCGAILGRLCRRIGQPPVIGEVIAGIVLGPSLLGQISPAAQQFILPAQAAPFLGLIAQFGIVLYMFLLGLELDLGLLKRNARATVMVSQASIVVPFLFGVMLAFPLYPRLAPPEIPFLSFCLFIGIALAITAFPVLARILSDQGMTRTPLGSMALTCAAINDVMAWCLLAVVVGVAKAQVGSGLLVIAGAAVFVGVMMFVIRPLALRFTAKEGDDDSSRGLVTIVFLALLASSLTAEWIGIHAIFGAFLLGAIIPHDSAIARTFTHKLEDLVTIVFLPAFFAFTGMRTQIAAVETGMQWMWCGIIIVVAVIGKFGGTYAASRYCGLDNRDASALGILMNTRGLMELIVLNIGLDLGIVSPPLFAMMVLMALATTLATTPVLNRIVRLHPRGSEASPRGLATICSTNPRAGVPTPGDQVSH